LKCIESDLVLTISRAFIRAVPRGAAFLSGAAVKRVLVDWDEEPAERLGLALPQGFAINVDDDQLS